MLHSCSVQGLEVQGTYSYVDPTGAIVTVNYNVSSDGDDVQCVTPVVAV